MSPVLDQAEKRFQDPGWPFTGWVRKSTGIRIKTLAMKREFVHYLFVSAINDRLGVLFTMLRESVAAQNGFKLMTGPLIIRIWTQLHWIERRLYRAIARAVAGKLPRPSRARANPPTDADATTAPAASRKPPKLPLPRREAWLIPLMPPRMPALHVAAAYPATSRPR